MGTDTTTDELYKKLVDDSQKKLISFAKEKEQQEKIVNQINDFLDKYPKTVLPDNDPKAPWVTISIKELARRCIQTLIDIINEVSDTLSQRQELSMTQLRRQIFKAFTKEERRLYVGFWLIILSFILYFIDSAA